MEQLFYSLELCSICSEYYNYVNNIPYQTSCNHFLCSECIQKITECPFCKHLLDGKYTIADDLLVNNELQYNETINDQKKIENIINQQKQAQLKCKQHNLPFMF